ncbi:hypothetical protein DIPPA_33399 [Diplonema papillatum]|nr:hypothetical protein DIPPA_33399 [Diplonema papillatum]
MPASGNIVQILSNMLLEFTKRNDKVRQDVVGDTAKSPAPAMFEAYQAPAIPVDKYFARLDKYFNNSEECYVYSLILVDRLINKHPTLYLTSHNVHRLLVTSVVISAKVRDDCYYSNKYYSAVAGIRLSELNYLEIHFLLLLDFDLHVSLSEFCRYIYEISTRYGTITGNSAKYVHMASQFLDDEDDQNISSTQSDDDEKHLENGDADMEDHADEDSVMDET